MTLHLSFFEFIVRGIPEAVLFIFAVCIFSSTKIEIKKFIISSLILSVATFLVRMLPISYGIHTILNIIILVIITTVVVKLSIIGSIRSCILTAILMFICEGINMGLIQLTHGSEIERIFANPILKTVYGLPSLMIFAIILLLYKFNRKGIKSV
ncbi:hypothetical protein K5V21_02475 [Clostridium sardiniense]|uniref:Uncharacterized protein n=1 Tax=Clostridium sardiniense TaxID=29369 RepID=A0ABS7KUN2_CLOSR|nr:hypothetical protein [Clostridium sardiniense]MBY0754312.1 hypothetical protein [Clostridium sardiniense]MDQ0461044.1 hypothetical protein [Clostridium sardiniense]